MHLEASDDGYIQNKLMFYPLGVLEVAQNWYTCDGIVKGSACTDNTAYNAECDEHYVLYAGSGEDFKLCIAVTDDDGNLLYDADGEPYGHCNDCELVSDTW